MRRLALLGAAALAVTACAGTGGPSVRATVLPWAALHVEGSGWPCGTDVVLSLPEPWGYRLPTSVDRGGRFQVEVPEVQREPPQAVNLSASQSGCGSRRTRLRGWYTSSVDQALIDAALARAASIAPFARHVGVAPCHSHGFRSYCRTIARHHWYGAYEVVLIAGWPVDEGRTPVLTSCPVSGCDGPPTGVYVFRIPGDGKVELVGGER